LVRWRRDRPDAVVGRLAVPIAVTVAALLAGWLGDVPLLPLLGLAVSAGLAVASVAPLWRRNLVRTPLFTWGMVVAHLGIAVALAGMACDSAFTRETLVAARPGEGHRVGPWLVTFDGVAPRVGANWSAVEARLTATCDDTTLVLHPQSRFFADPPTTTAESAIATRLDGQLYTVLGAPDGEGRWQLRLWWKPFVTLIWAGGALVAIGGALSLVGRVTRERRARERDGWRYWTA
ncbi:cytochrome c-type biogenesis CcmF C-terminal domain-containing protein, partial [Sphingomonas bacterium]|uniref:cytochrome c-type biogenesis CcmF C-terminal domain-containing protein n=1 Tax=Sphingomonas bacterium TaxID=1895847 RepID=UPI0026708CC1